jgi:hypothetical protein
MKDGRRLGVHMSEALTDVLEYPQYLRLFHPPLRLLIHETHERPASTELHENQDLESAMAQLRDSRVVECDNIWMPRQSFLDLI